MGSPEPKSNQIFSVMDPGVASGTSSVTPSEVTPVTCSSDDSSKSKTGSVDLQKTNEDGQLASDYNKEDFPVGFMPTINEQLSEGSATESPLPQVMDRAAESALPDQNRIPSRVFARNKSTAQVEWSVASNESLFSIHMGNMSLTNEQLSWMNKSGDFGFTGDCPYSTHPPLPPVNKSNGLGATEAVAAETMREVLRENASDPNNGEKLPLSAKLSDDPSIKSFAFPILTGDGNKSITMSINHVNNKKQHSQPSMPKTAEEPETPGAKSETMTPKEQTPKATTKNAGHVRWFSCFSCCPSCL